MRCTKCGAPFVSGKKDGLTVCSRCKDSTSPVRWVSAGVEAEKNPKPPKAQSSIPKRPITSETIATGFTRSHPPDRPTIKSMPAAKPAQRKRVSDENPVRTSSQTAGRNTPSEQPTSVVLEGKYRLIDELGRGSMGTVFLAQDILLKRKVAVKFLLPELAHSTECAIRFKREAIAMASIRNENVAQIYSYGEDRGIPYFVMEYLEGQTVEELIDSHNRRGVYVPLGQAVDIMIQVSVGVAAIHRANAVHRDIKPGNIMVTSDPTRAVIMDFGLVRDIKLEDDIRTLAGTPAYIAPELVEEKEGASRSKLADIYSLGATFYELITGSIPFNGESWVEILQKHIAEIPSFPTSARSGIPEALEDLILRAMSKEPRERFASCDDLLDKLLEIAEKNELVEPRRSLIPSRPAAVRNSGAPINLGTARQTGRNREAMDSGRVYRVTPAPEAAKLLVADGDRQFRSLIYNSVKSAIPECNIHSATDGRMAMDMVKSILPDVLVINMALSEMNGFEIVASLAGEQDLSKVNVFVVADGGGPKDAQLLRAMGVKSVWTKPVDADELLAAMLPFLDNGTRI